MIYFIRDESTDRIKIGTTIRLSQRLYQLGLVTAGPLHVLAVIPGSYADEKVLHARFRAHCDVGEWFRPDGELIDFIATEGQPWDGSDESAAYVPVKMDADVVRRAKIVASYRNQSLAEFLSESMRPIVDRLIDEEHDRETKAVRSPKGKGSK